LLADIQQAENEVTFSRWIIHYELFAQL